MNELGFLFWMASIAALFSLPLILFAVLMRLVGRINSRGLAGILLFDAVLWAFAGVFWWGRPEHGNVLHPSNDSEFMR